MNFIIQLIVIAVLVGLGYYAWRAWQRRADPQGAAGGDKPAASVSEAGIEQVRVGGMIQLPPHGEDMDTSDMQITARHVYEEDGFRWFELEGESTSGTKWLDVSRDDELETSVTLRRMGLEDIGLAAESVQQLGKGGQAKVAFDGHHFEFVEKGRATFRPNGDSANAQVLDYWDFEGDDDKHDLGIESWDGQYRVYLSQRIDPARIRIYSLGETP